MGGEGPDISFVVRHFVAWHNYNDITQFVSLLEYFAYDEIDNEISVSTNIEKDARPSCGDIHQDIKFIQRMREMGFKR